MTDIILKTLKMTDSFSDDNRDDSDVLNSGEEKI